MNLSPVEVLYTFGSVLAGGHRDVAETSYSRCPSISDYFGSDDLKKKAKQIQKNKDHHPTRHYSVTYFAELGEMMFQVGGAGRRRQAAHP